MRPLTTVPLFLSCLFALTNQAAAQRLEASTGEGDADRDGVLDRVDGCPTTPRGQLPVDSGCAAVELPALAGLKSRALAAHFEELESDLAVEPELSRQLDGVVAAANAYQAATDRLYQGELAKAATSFGESNRLLEAALREIILQRSELRISATDIPEGATEYHGKERREILLAYLESQLTDVTARVRAQGQSAIAAAQKLGGELRMRGTVEASDPQGRWVKLRGGPTMMLPAARAPQHPLDGIDIEVIGNWLGEDAGVAGEVIAPFDLGSAPLQIRCTELRVAPVQQFFGATSPYLLQHPRGYTSDGVLWLEKGMRLAAADLGCGVQQTPDGKEREDILTLRLDYTDKAGLAQHTLLAAQLAVGEAPIELPGDADPGKAATLTVKTFDRQCKPGTWECSYSLRATEKHTVRLRERYSYCTALSYDSEVFTLPDNDPNAYQTTFATKFVPLFIENTDSAPAFGAEGYPVVNGISSRPQVKSIQGAQKFAIYSQDDFFNAPGQLWPSIETSGVSAASGVKWPRLQGKRQGQPFRYSCRTPSLVRDGVNFCAAGPNSFYRIPFTPHSQPVWSVTQGNFGPFSHQNVHAWDFMSKDLVDDWGMPVAASTEIRAARGGKVVWVEDSNTDNCFDLADGDGEEAKKLSADGKCDANGIGIRHQDGSVAYYFHIKPDSAQVAVGDVIKRGKLIGIEGNIGYSTDPHLHFEVAIWGLGTITSRFQDKSHTCWIPVQNDWVMSNNTP